MAKITIGLLCGGSSREKGISLNSARSVMDHLHGEEIEIAPVYFDSKNQPHAVRRAQLYSNTPDDFEWKLEELGRALDHDELIEHLRGFDLVFPAIHGAFGEGGGLMRLLEEAGVPYVGSPSKACATAFDKHEAGLFLAEHGFYALPTLLVEAGRTDDAEERIAAFLAETGADLLVVKPARSGSSIGVSTATTAAAAASAARQLFADGLDLRAVVEPFCRGSEFTLIVLQNADGEPVALLPTEIEIDPSADRMFDYRKKYLPTRQVIYRMPPTYSDEVVARIRRTAEEVFRLFGMRDVARFDGWVLDGGELWFSDFNMISGMEQNSFIFLQSAQLGLSHRDLLKLLVTNACRRHGLDVPSAFAAADGGERRRVDILFGGGTSERHVSLMSGTNVWLKLLSSKRWDPRPFLLDPDGEVWELPYAMTLRHTVEEVVDACHQAIDHEERLRRFRGQILERLEPPPELVSGTRFIPRRLSLEEFVATTPRVFVALHGGIGENGELQAMLEARGVPFTGSGSAASRRAMDKYVTGRALAGLEGEGIRVATKELVRTSDLEAMNAAALGAFWGGLRERLGGESVVVKPNDDGCSSGVARLYASSDLAAYLAATSRRDPRIPAGTLEGQHGIIEMPTERSSSLLFERFVETDELLIDGGNLDWRRRTGWIEVTVGVLGPRGAMRALTPSVTVASGGVLSLEEKFQGGTGTNLTPPPEPWVARASVEACRRRIARVAQVLELSGFARIDAFMDVGSGEVIVIEANTIPGLTPSTVIYHQALAEDPPLYPRDFLERIAETAFGGG